MARAALRKKARPAPVAPVAAPPGLLGTLRGDAYQLGPEVGSGGEGIIRAVARRPELLAKLYRHTPQPHDVDKLRALVRAATPDLLNVTAWPTDCLKDRKGTVVGFIMPRVSDARPTSPMPTSASCCTPRPTWRACSRR